jgi:hypothetical protein
MDVSGFISAVGGGGRAGGRRSGGGGGGSGGGILLQGDSVTVDMGARISANGGAGGEGGPDSNTVSQSDGQNGNALSPLTAAIGGATSGQGGNGGNGATQALSAAAGQLENNNAAAGGGGGGGFGRLRIDARTGCTINGSALISPLPHGATQGTPSCPP